MLNIYIYEYDKYKGYPASGYVSDVKGIFDDEREPEWFKDDFVKKIIQDIDKSVVRTISDDGFVTLTNDILGELSVNQLSSGCKALILLYKTDFKINGDRMGDNCVPLLLEIAVKKDIYISLHHIMQFPEKFEAVIVNNGERIHSKNEYIDWTIELE